MVGFDNNVDFEDDFNYEKSDLSIKQIILSHIKKIGTICCKEFVGSWWEKRPITTQSGIVMIEIYHEDLREAYCNAVDFLVDLVTPDSDEEFINYIKENEKIEDKDIDIKEKLLRKRITFRKINEMFKRTNYFNSSTEVNE